MADDLGVSMGAMLGSQYSDGWRTEWFPEPFFDMASLAMPQTIQSMHRWCLVPGTPIELAGLQHKPVEAVVPGDVVLTRGGTHERVAAVGVRPVDEEIVAITVAGSKRLPLRLTGNHKVWCVRGNGTLPRGGNVDLTTVVEVPAAELRVGDYLFAPQLRLAQRAAARFPGWLFGMYLAEGCPVESAGRFLLARFTLGRDDEATGILARLVAELRASTSELVDPYTPPSRPDVRVLCCHDVELPDWLHEHGGRYSQHKSLSPRVLEYGEDFLLDMIAGYLDGDGWLLRDRGGVQGLAAESASGVLLRQLRRIANALGMAPTVNKLRDRDQRKLHGETLNVGSAYRIAFGRRDAARFVGRMVKLRDVPEEQLPRNNGDRHDSITIIRGGCVYRPIREIAREHYTGPVHNIEVENDHSYIAGGVVVSNCEFLMMSQGLLCSAIGRKIKYFMTDVDIRGEDIADDEKKDYKQYLCDELHVLDHAELERMNDACYGNSFCSVVESFTRYFSCKHCRIEFTFETLTQQPAFRHAWTNYEMTATCPRCETRGPWRMFDRRGGRDGDLLIKHWSVHEMQLVWDPFSHRTAYIWMIPEDYRRQVTEGRPHTLRYAPPEVIEAVKAGQHIRFGDDYIFHGMTRTFSGVRNRGWGISRLLTSFRQAWYVQVLHRFNEAIGLDYVVPIRLLSPASGGGGEATDPLLNMPMGNMSAQVEQMVRLHRQDPGTMHWFPFPVAYQTLGGEASQLAPYQLLDQGIDTLLNMQDVPVELYKMTLSAQSASPALRIFESVHRSTPSNTNRFLAFVMKKVAAYKDWPQATAQLLPTTIIDDVSKSMPKVQLMGSGIVSPQTGLAQLGLDAAEELRKNLDFQRLQQETQQEVQDEMEQAGLQQQLVTPPLAQLVQGQLAAPGAGGGGDMGPAAAAAGPAGAGAAQAPAAQQFAAQSQMPNDMPIDPREIMSRAHTIAQTLRQMPEGQKDSILRRMKQQNEALHAAVRSALDDQREQEAQQAQAQGQVIGKSAGLFALQRKLQIK